MFSLPAFSGSSSTDISRLLNSVSLSDQETILNGLLASESPDPSHFASCVKTAFSSNQRIRELSATYLIMHANENSELSLMLVNSLQRMLADSNPAMRVHALRLSAALKSPAAGPILAHLLASASIDVSPFVRVACFQSIGTCYELDPSLNQGLLNLLVTSLKRTQNVSGEPEVGGWGLTIIGTHWPQRLDAVHALFPLYVSKLPNFENFSQVIVTRLFLRYCKQVSIDRNSPQCRMLLESAKKMLMSLDSAVVIEACNVLTILGSEIEQNAVPNTLLSLPLTPLLAPSILQIGLKISFNEFREQIIMRNYDVGERVPMMSLASTCTKQELSLQEVNQLILCLLVWEDDTEGCQAVLNCISTLIGPKNVFHTLKNLCKLAANPSLNSDLKSLILQNVRILVELHDLGREEQLLRMLCKVATNKEVEPHARAAIISLISQNCTYNSEICLELVRVLVKNFSAHDPEVRMQILLASAKLAILESEKHPITTDILNYVVQLCKYDENVGIRDRARMFVDTDVPLIKLMLVADKPSPKVNPPEIFEVDTASSVLGYRTSMYSEIPEFATTVSFDALETFTSATDDDLEFDSEKLDKFDANNVDEKHVDDSKNKTHKMSLNEFLGESNSSPAASDDYIAEYSSVESLSDSSSEATEESGEE